MSTLAYFINQLDNFDTKLYDPLYDVTYGRDIKMRSGISMANESSSYQRSNYGVVGTQTAQGKPWIGQASNSLANMTVDGERIVAPIRPLGLDVAYSSIELERSRLLNQPIDVQQLNGMKIAYEMWTDEMVYKGDADTANPVYGLINSPEVTASNVVVGVSGFTEWNKKTPQEKLFDVNTALQQDWEASGYAIAPRKLLLPPEQFSLIVAEIVSSAGNISTLKFLQQNSLCTAKNGVELDIQPVKWLKGAGAGGTDRMMVYTNDENRVRFPMVPIRRETAYFESIYYHAPYTWAYGQVEFPYPETLLYADGI